MLLLPWMLILLAVPLHGYDVMMVIGGRYYDHARQAYIELATVEVSVLNNLFHVISNPTPDTPGTANIKEFWGFLLRKMLHNDMPRIQVVGPNHVCTLPDLPESR